jgi:hypothetical protein
MRLKSICAVAALLFAGSVDRLFAELYTVARVTDLCGNASFQVCTEAECRKIQAELGEESKAFAKTVDAAKSEWNLSRCDAPFPTSRIKTRTFKVLNTAISREEANKLMAEAKIKEERALAKEKEEAQQAIKGPRVLLARGAKAALEKREEALEERERDKVTKDAEAVVRKKLAAAVGHEVPYYGKADEEPKRQGLFGQRPGR